MPSNMRPPHLKAVLDEHYYDKPWGSPPSSERLLPLSAKSDALWLFSDGRHLLNPHDHMRVAQANMGASRPPLRTMNVMEGIRQLHKATLLKTRLDAVFATF